MLRPCNTRPQRSAVRHQRSAVRRGGVIARGVDPAAVALLAAVAALPGGVLLDQALDKSSPRVDRVSNTRTSAGTRLYVARPPKGVAPRGTVVLLHQILGLQPREAQLCDDLAADGWLAVAPDMFEGQSTGYIPRALALGWEAALKPGASWGLAAVQDTVRWLRSQPEAAAPQPLVVAGWCLGGGAAVRYAAAEPGECSGVCIFYGRPLLERSEVQRIGAIPVLAMYGTSDSQFPAAMVDKFEEDLRAVGCPAPTRVVRFPGQGHAFMTDLEAVRRGGAAGEAWALFKSFLSECCPSPRAVSSRAQQ